MSTGFIQMVLSFHALNGTCRSFHNTLSALLHLTPADPGFPIGGAATFRKLTNGETKNGGGGRGGTLPSNFVGKMKTFLPGRE